jgi:hypothetical protein
MRGGVSLLDVDHRRLDPGLVREIVKINTAIIDLAGHVGGDGENMIEALVQIRKHAQQSLDLLLRLVSNTPGLVEMAVRRGRLHQLVGGTFFHSKQCINELH